MRAEERDGRTLLLVNDAVAALEGTIAWDERTRSYEVKIKGRTAVFGAESPIAVVDTKVVNLASPVRASSLGAWAEPEFFVKVLGPLDGPGARMGPGDAHALGEEVGRPRRRRRVLRRRPR